MDKFDKSTIHCSFKKFRKEWENRKGAEFFTSITSPDLKIGITFTRFNSLGTTL
jgi:hypothetical protein